MYTFFWPKDIVRYLDILLAYRQKYICDIYFAYVVSSFFEYAYFRMYTCRYINIHVHTFIFVVCMYRCTSVHAYLLTYIIYLERIKVWIHVCIYTCLHIYICTHTHSYSVSYLHKMHIHAGLFVIVHISHLKDWHMDLFLCSIYIYTYIYLHVYTYNYIYTYKYNCLFFTFNYIVCFLHTHCSAIFWLHFGSGGMQLAVHSWPQGEVVISLRICCPRRCIKWRRFLLHLTSKCAHRLRIEGELCGFYAWFNITVVHFSGHPSGNWPLKVWCSLGSSPELFKPFTRPLWFLVVLLMASELKMT